VNPDLGHPRFYLPATAFDRACCLSLRSHARVDLVRDRLGRYMAVLEGKFGPQWGDTLVCVVKPKVATSLK
jgi:hypothetical protein